MKNPSVNATRPKRVGGIIDRFLRIGYEHNDYLFLGQPEDAEWSHFAETLPGSPLPLR